MLNSNTLSIDFGGKAGPANPVILNKIRDDNGNSEYLFRGTVNEHQIWVTHGNENVKAGNLPTERHTIKWRVTRYATDTVPEYFTEVVMITKLAPADPLLEGSKLNVESLFNTMTIDLIGELHAKLS